MDWKTLKTDCLACQRCPLHTTRHNVVFGQGVENAEVLFVGEGPGQSEDEQGLPFVGRSGSCWTNTSSPSTSTVPPTAISPTSSSAARPEPRPPCPAESEACMPWLREQFRLLRPKIVVCLGRIAAQRMIRNDFSVTKEHGTFIEKNGILFMGTFHPAALLRQPQNKPEAFGDFVAAG